MFLLESTKLIFRSANSVLQDTGLLPEELIGLRSLVDFDMLYGHRNNPRGYADALEAFDRRLPEFFAALGENDVLALTADHGNDPTTPSTDHSREYVPLLITGSSVKGGVNIGVRETFADLAATIAATLGARMPPSGKSFAPIISASPPAA